MFNAEMLRSKDGWSHVCFNAVNLVISFASWTWHRPEPPAAMEKLHFRKLPVLFFSDELCPKWITKLCLLISYIRWYKKGLVCHRMDLLLWYILGKKSYLCLYFVTLSYIYLLLCWLICLNCTRLGCSAWQNYCWKTPWSSAKSFEWYSVLPFPALSFFSSLKSWYCIDSCST